MELDNTTYIQITTLSEEGDKLAKRGKFENALEKYQLALSLLPEPKNIWEAATWLNAAIGDAYFFLKQYDKALNVFLDGRNCPDGTTNPFLHLRIGECYFELNDKAKAEEFLLRAYMWEGSAIFEMEEKKYVNFMKEKYDIS